MKKLKKRAAVAARRSVGMGMAKKTEKFQPLSANVKVIGVGGGGNNAVARMARDFFRGVDFVAINTNHQDLDHCDVKHRLYIGKNLTRGLGTGMNPELGCQAAEENRAEIAEMVKGADLVFLAAGFGGGTGTGATPIIAETAKQAGALTIAVVTKPFAFEGTQRERIATEGLMKLKDKVDALIVVPNDRIFSVISKDTPILKAFEAIDDVLRNALKGLVEIIAMPGIVNVDFADVKNIMQDAGVAIVGTGLATGADRAVSAVNLALHSPLLESTPDGAKAVLLGISGGRDLKMTEINDAAKLVAATVDPGARIIFGAYYDRNLKDKQVKITVVATGFSGSQPNMLFGNNNHYAERQAIFGRPSLINGDTPAVTKKPHLTPVSEPVVASTASATLLNKDMLVKDARKEKANDVDALSFSSTVAKSQPAIDERKARMAREAKEKEDAWDLPAFLRRRKK